VPFGALHAQGGLCTEIASGSGSFVRAACFFPKDDNADAAPSKLRRIA
jgi:hypothetical protein